MNYAEVCRQKAEQMRILRWQPDVAALLDAAAGLYESCMFEHAGYMAEAHCDVCNAVAAANAAARGAE